jgi:hypothetical protein
MDERYEFIDAEHGGTMAATSQKGMAEPIPDAAGRDFTAAVPGGKMAGDITRNSVPEQVCIR